jgi:hypothetical protein
VAGVAGGAPIQDIEAEHARIAKMGEEEVDKHKKLASRKSTGAFELNFYINGKRHLERLLDYARGTLCRSGVTDWQ